MANHLERLALFANPCFRAVILFLTSVCKMGVRIRLPAMGREKWLPAGRKPFDVCSMLCYTSLMNETLTRTICIKLDVNGHDAVLHETQQRFNAAASWIAT